MLRASSKEILVKLENYKGPLHALLELIEKRKLSINEISLSQVTDDFLSKAEEYQASKDLYAEFISIAATLIYIKSKSLLPFVEEKEEEESEELQRRLKALQELKKQSKGLLDRFKKANSYILSRNFKRTFKLPQEFSPYKEYNLDLAKQNIVNILSSIDITPQFKVKRRTYKSLDSFIKKIDTLLKKYDKIKFHDIGFESKEDKIVAFLAILELRRKGQILIEKVGKDFQIEADTNKAPFYG